MRHKFTNLFILAVFCLLQITATIPILAQEQEEITEGTEFWFGMPWCGRHSTEPIRWGTYPVEIWISSKVDTKFTISSADGSTIPTQTWNLKAKEIKALPLPELLENRESEKAGNKGIHIESDDPISVGVMVAYKWSGEAYRVTPVQWLGKKYYTLNLYQDSLKFYDGKLEARPAEILIVATENNTKVTYKPKWDTKGGVKAGQEKTVTLNKGQTFLILAKTVAELTWDWSTDLSGTYISANKPIAVISGHSKAAFPRFGVYALGLKSDFMRNMLMEMMWPIEHLGTEYVSAPIKYNDRSFTDRNERQDSKGDMIRFVATEDNTLVYQMRADGSGLKQISNKMKAGDFYDVTNQEDPAYYRANKKVLVGHYGKAWWLYNVLSTDGNKDDNTLNPSRNGQGMMMTLTPIEKWCGYASFKSVKGMDAFMCLTFRTVDKEKIKFDGSLLTTKFGTSVKEIPGTEFSYIVEVISAEDHFLEATEKGVKFAAYAYGNWDQYKDGFAYGYPVGMNYASECDDSVYVISKMECGNVTATAYAVDLQTDTTCAQIFSVTNKGGKLYNYEYNIDEKFEIGDKTAKFTYTVINPDDTAQGVIDIMLKSGKTLRKTFKYTPEKIDVTPTNINYGLLKLNQTKCEKFTITNPTTGVVEVKSLRLKNNTIGFAISSVTTPFTLAPKESKEIEVCATGIEISTKTYKDSVIAELSCYEKSIVGLQYTTGEPIVEITDAHWDPQPIGNETSRKVDIRSIGTSEVILETMDWSDKVHFTKVENLDGTPFTITPTQPLVLQVGDVKSFNVFYKADQIGQTDQTVCNFTGNTVINKLYSNWDGSGIDAGPTILGNEWGDKRVVDKYAGVTEYAGIVKIGAVGNSKLNVVDIFLKTNPDNVFAINKASKPTQLDPAAGSVEIPATFKPLAEKDYLGEVSLVTEFNHRYDTVSAQVSGRGLMPHVDIIGVDYGAPIEINKGKYADGLVELKHNNIKPSYAMPLTVYGLKIDGTDKADFAIDATWYNDNFGGGKKLTIPVGGFINVPVRFTPTQARTENAQIIVDADVDPAFADPTDNFDADLTGKGFYNGMVTTDYPFPTIYISLGRDGKVYLENTGSVPFTVTRDITLSAFGSDKIQITKWYTSKLNNPLAPFIVEPSDKLWVEANFSPMFDKETVESEDYRLKIEYVTDIGIDSSVFTGKGIIYQVHADIPEYHANSFGDIINVEFKLAKHTNETQALEKADIRDFKAEITFKNNLDTLFDVHPYPTDFKPANLITQGTMTQGWECLYTRVFQLNNQTILQVHLTNVDQALTNNNSDVLFKVPMKVYFKNMEKIPLTCNFAPQDVSEITDNKPAEYVRVTTDPGEITKPTVCVDSLRLVELMGTTSYLNAAVPNPVEVTTKIQYGLADENSVNITIYNSYGEKVMVLVDELQQKGDHELTINAKDLNLPNGVYFYTMKSGSFQNTKQLVIMK